jgi:hypothetical protein
MTRSPLTAFWIVPPCLKRTASPVRSDRTVTTGLLGFGVTALSIDDAVFIIRALGYGGYLPDLLGTLQIHSGVTVAGLDHPHVVANMGPIVVRGMWYPFFAVGVPKWANADPGTAPDVDWS